jgi:hypothetical protein
MTQRDKRDVDPFSFKIPTEGDTETKLAALDDYLKKIGVTEYPKLPLKTWECIFKTETEIDIFDFVFEGGRTFAVPGPPPRIRIRDMYKYCKSVGKQPSELTEGEMEQFRYKG